jgi:hypothetical protein
MEYEKFLTKVVDDGIEAARKSYAERPDKLRGAVAGFESCRGKSPEELRSALETAGKATQMARVCRADNYWEVRCFEAEIEWVCNVVSAAMLSQNAQTVITPTARGMLKAADILGVRGAS